MTLTLTGITKAQWSKVAKVFFWLALSFVISLVPAYLTKHYQYLAGAPAINLVLYTLTQIFQQELTGAEGQLPATDQASVDQAVSQVLSRETPSDPPTPATPTSIPVQSD